MRREARADILFLQKLQPALIKTVRRAFLSSMACAGNGKKRRRRKSYRWDGKLNPWNEVECTWSCKNTSCDRKRAWICRGK
jgi:hypothetical protein